MLMKYIPPPLVRGEGGRGICQKIIKATTATICCIPCEVKVTVVNKIDKGLAPRGLLFLFSVVGQEWREKMVNTVANT